MRQPRMSIIVGRRDRRSIISYRGHDRRYKEQRQGNEAADNKEELFQGCCGFAINVTVRKIGKHLSLRVCSQKATYAVPAMTLMIITRVKRLSASAIYRLCNLHVDPLLSRLPHYLS